VRSLGPAAPGEGEDISPSDDRGYEKERGSDESDGLHGPGEGTASGVERGRAQIGGQVGDARDSCGRRVAGVDRRAGEQDEVAAVEGGV
jgi:hypothetical protein